MAADERGSEAKSAHDRILAAVAVRDRIIEQQGTILALSNQVMGEASTEVDVTELVNATYRVVNCERVSVWILEDGCLVCRAAPAGGAIGIKCTLGNGVAGHVAVTGEMLNIPDAYDRLDIFDSTFDLATNFRTRSVLAMPIRDKTGLVGVLQVINKRSLEGGGLTAFDAIDIRMLNVLLGLTAQQLRMCELLCEHADARKRSQTTLALVEAICRARELDEALDALATGIRDLLNCKRAYVFLKEQDSFVCRAACFGDYNAAQELRLNVDDPIVGVAHVSHGPLSFSATEQPEDINFLQHALQGRQASPAPSEQRDNAGDSSLASSLAASPMPPALPPGCQVQSAMCAPLCQDSQHGSIGVVLAVNRVLRMTEMTGSNADAPNSGEANSFASPKRRRSTLGLVLQKTSEFDTITEELGDFVNADAEQLNVLLRLAGQYVRTHRLYEVQCRTTRKLEALISLLADAKAALGARDVRKLASLILAKSLMMFECDRCTFFTVDSLNAEFLGYFRAEGSGELQELRIPMQGIAGVAAKENSLLNIRDAWSDRRFSNQTDLRTGYRTMTLLCAPLTTSTGKVIAVLQCINKARAAFFDDDDEKMLITVSALLSDLLQQMVQGSSFESFIEKNDAIDSNVKDMFREFNANPRRRATQAEPDREVNRVASSKESGLEQRMKCWDFDTDPLVEEPNKTLAFSRACFAYFGLVDGFNINPVVLDSTVQAIRNHYSQRTHYHNWSHAFGTLHATFLLLDSWAFAGLLRDEDILGLLIAALGHDVEHPGYTNTFLVNTRHQLAIRYNDLSVLESHHAATTCGIVTEDRGGVLQGLCKESVDRVRFVLVSTILGTDMAKHQECIDWCESSTVDLPGARKSGSKLRSEDAAKLSNAVLHAADLVHPALTWKVHRRRSLQIAAEFFQQFYEETSLGLPTLPFMGKDPGHIQGLAPIQTGFIQFVAAPLWAALNFVAGEDRFAVVKTNIEQNRQTWQQVGDGKEVDDDQPFQDIPQKS